MNMNFYMILMLVFLHRFQAFSKNVFLVKVFFIEQLLLSIMNSEP